MQQFLKPVFFALGLLLAAPAIAQSDPQVGLTDMLAALFRADPDTAVEVPDPLVDFMASNGTDIDLASVLALAVAVNTGDPANTLLSYAYDCEDGASDGALSCSLAIITKAEEDGETYESAIVLAFDLSRDADGSVHLTGDVAVSLAG